MAQAKAIFRIVAEPGEGWFSFFEPVQADLCSYPNISLPVFKNGSYSIITDRVRVSRAVYIFFVRTINFWIMSTEAICCSQPKLSFPVFEKGIDTACAEGRMIILRFLDLLSAQCSFSVSDIHYSLLTIAYSLSPTTHPNRPTTHSCRRLLCRHEQARQMV